MPDQMPEPRQQPAAIAKPEPAKVELTPAGSATDPAVHQLLAELATSRANGADDDAQDLVNYLAGLGYRAG